MIECLVAMVLGLGSACRRARQFTLSGDVGRLYWGTTPACSLCGSASLTTMRSDRRVLPTADSEMSSANRTAALLSSPTERAATRDVSSSSAPARLCVGTGVNSGGACGRGLHGWLSDLDGNILGWHLFQQLPGI